MPISFLTAAERERWQRFPDTIPQDDLVGYFLLSEADTREVHRQREPPNRLGYALQLCTLRYLGFVPTDFQAMPAMVVTFVAEQLGLDPRRPGPVHQQADPECSAALCAGLLGISSGHAPRCVCLAHLAP